MQMLMSSSECGVLELTTYVRRLTMPLLLWAVHYSRPRHQAPLELRPPSAAASKRRVFQGHGHADMICRLGSMLSLRSIGTTLTSSRRRVPNPHANEMWRIWATSNSNS